MRLIGGQHRRLALAHRVGRVGVHDLPDHQPIEKDAQSGEVLLDRGRCEFEPQLLNVRSPCTAHQEENCEITRAYARRVFGFLMLAVKNSSVLLAAAGVGRNSAGNLASPDSANVVTFDPGFSEASYHE